MKITVVSVGRIKEKHMVDGIKEYSKRLSRYCKLQLIEVADERAPENLSVKDENIVKKKEGDKILAKIKANTYVITLVIQGKQLSSEQLSEKISDLMLRGISDITFIIGGSLGLSDEVIARSDFKLSFSNMTFPHQLMKMILLEQVYRSWRIIKNEPYHK